MVRLQGDVCVSEAGDGRAANGRWRFAQSYDYALKTLSDARFDRWREFDPRTGCAFTRCGCTRWA